MLFPVNYIKSLSTKLPFTWLIATHEVFIDSWVYVHCVETANAEENYCDILYYNLVEAV